MLHNFKIKRDGDFAIVDYDELRCILNKAELNETLINVLMADVEELFKRKKSDGIFPENLTFNEYIENIKNEI